MADEDQSQKTEEPTQKRLDDARAKGQVAKSQEVSHWFMICAIAALIAMLSEPMARGVSGALVGYLERPHALSMDAGNLFAVFREGALDLLLAIGLPVALLMAAALASNLVQNPPLMAWDKLKPDLSRLSPLAGAKRIFGTHGLVELAKSIAKIVVGGGVACAVVWPQAAQLELAVGMDVGLLLATIRDQALLLVLGVAAVVTVIAGVDVAWQRHDHHQQQMMSRQEVKDEMKQSDGDPHVKARIRQIRTERARRRMMAAVPGADVVVTNPTHYAVALKYDQATMAAPRVVAKGVDHLAQKIREVAKQHGVPVVENPPLARGLHAAVEVDQEIPVEFYRAVAELIGYVMRLRGRLAGARR